MNIEGPKYLELIDSIVVHEPAYNRLSPEGQDVWKYGLEELMGVITKGITSRGGSLRDTFYNEARDIIEVGNLNKQRGYITSLLRRLRNVDPETNGALRQSVERSLRITYESARFGKEVYTPRTKRKGEPIWGDAPGRSNFGGLVSLSSRAGMFTIKKSGHGY